VRPALVSQDTGTNRRLGMWPALLAYVMLSQIHQWSLRTQAASKAVPPHFAVVIGLHALAFLTAALVLGRGKADMPRQKLPLFFTVFVTEVISWKVLGRLGAHGHIALSVALLSGFMLPLCMATSALLLGRRFRPLAWMGAVMVALGVGCCTLGNPLTKITNATEVGLLVAACCFPCLSLIGKEALMSGKWPLRLSIPIVGLLICLAQLTAIVVPPWASAPALHVELASLWHRQHLLYVVLSGLLRVSILVLICSSSASTLQLVNALAVPLVATILTSGLEQNVHALLFALGGGVLYVFEQKEIMTKAAAPFVSRKGRQRKMDKLGLNDNGTKEKRQQERLRRLQERWKQEEQREAEQQQQQQQKQRPPEPIMYAPEDQ